MEQLLLELHWFPAFTNGWAIDLLGRMALDLSLVFILVFAVYRSRAEDSQGYVFTFFVFNFVIFFICGLISTVEISMGFGFGLFALFSILRYRTVTINIREMAFLFAVISVGIINALPYEHMSWLELIAIDLVMLVGIWILHAIVYKQPLTSIIVKYEKMEMLAPERKEELLADLRKRTGMNIKSYRIEHISFMTDSADIRIFVPQAAVPSLPQEP